MKFLEVKSIRFLAGSRCFCLSSGSHFNPPFTLAIYLCGGLDMSMVFPYLACQLLGGVLGAAMAKVSPARPCRGFCH